MSESIENPKCQMPDPGGGDIPQSQPGIHTIRQKVPQQSRLTPERLAVMKIATASLPKRRKQSFSLTFCSNQTALTRLTILRQGLHTVNGIFVYIPTVPQVPWQQQNVPLLKKAATEILKQNLMNGTPEFSRVTYLSHRKVSRTFRNNLRVCFQFGGLGRARVSPNQSPENTFGLLNQMAQTLLVLALMHLSSKGRDNRSRQEAGMALGR